MVNKNPVGSKNSSVDRGPVLVATDFSEDSKAALLWACSYAAQVGADVIVLHVIHEPAEAPGSYRKSEGDVLRPMEDLAADMMGKFVEDFRESHPDLQALSAVETQLVKGIPETRILEVAETTDARMIVMGSRGLTGLPHLLLGSKAERTAQLSPRPVTIVKGKRQHD
ncbi:MAG: universal stress protein [Inquilinus sp.]|nr:universal stress protein [Inquilinus sp.]